MNISLIDIGAVANDGTGDDLRTAFIKVNENFVELETSIDASTVAANVGDGQGIFKQKLVNELQFRSLDVNERLSISTDGDKIIIDTNFEDKTLRIGGIEVIGNDNGTMTIIGQNSVETGTFRGNLIGNVIGSVFALEPDYIIGRGNIVGINTEVGELDPQYSPARVDGISVKDLDRTINNFDFGDLDKIYTKSFAYLLDRVGIDLGTFISPADFDVDLGTL
jgi:hypothetical protein